MPVAGAMQAPSAHHHSRQRPAVHRQEIGGESRDHEHIEREMQRQPPERPEQQQEGRRIGKRVVAVGIHAERGLARMQRVGVEIDRGVAAMGDDGGGPQREEIAEMIGLLALQR